MKEANEKHSGKYLRMKGKGGVDFQRYTMLGLGILGILGVIVSIWMLPHIRNSRIHPVVLSGFLSLLTLVGMMRTGLELDPENKRFREFEGFRGNKKDPWIDVGNGDYLSIVTVLQTVYGQDRTPMGNPGTAAKVYFLSGDWHLEIFSGNLRESQEFAQAFSNELGLLVHDVTDNQDLPRRSQNSFY